MILFVGNTDDYLREYAKKIHANSVRIEQNNLDQIDSIEAGYISLGDHNLKDFITVMEKSSEIYYVPVTTWQHETTKKCTETWLNYFSHRKPVYNLSKNDLNSSSELVDGRKTESRQIWNAGCSITWGLGVNPNQRYGNLISKQLDLPISILAEVGSSISWASDQLIRSDIRKDDIVIWGLTGVNRLTVYHDGNTLHVNEPKFKKYSDILDSLVNKNILVSDHILQTEINAIDRVVKLSEKIGFKLILTLFSLNIIEHELKILEYLTKFKFFVSCFTDSNAPYIDYAIDRHPGPLQHKKYADILLDYIKNENIS